MSSDPTLEIKVHELNQSASPANHNPIENWRRFGVMVEELISSKEECFEDAVDAWTEHQTRAKTVYTKEKMASLLQNIDKLVDKENVANNSSEEDRKRCVVEIECLGRQINSPHRTTRKVVSSPVFGSPL